MQGLHYTPEWLNCLWGWIVKYVPWNFTSNRGAEKPGWRYYWIRWNSGLAEKFDAAWDFRKGECYEIRDICVFNIGHDWVTEDEILPRACMCTLKTHFVFLAYHWIEMLPFQSNYISVIQWHAILYFLLPGFIGLKGMIIRPVIGIYIQAHYPVSFGKYLTSSKQRKIKFSLCYDRVYVIDYVTFLAIKYTIFPRSWCNKTNVTFTWMCGLVD